MTSLALLRPGADPATLTPAQKEAVLRAYVFGAGRPPLLSALDVERLACAIDPSGRMQALAQAIALYRGGRVAEALALLRRVKTTSSADQQTLLKAVEALLALKRPKA